MLSPMEPWTGKSWSRDSTWLLAPPTVRNWPLWWMARLFPKWRALSPVRRLLAGLVVACAVGAVVVGAELASTASERSSEDSLCISTGLPSELGCAAQPKEQQEIEQRAGIAENAMWQVRDLAGELPTSPEMQAARRRAEAAAGRANDAVRGARAIMVDALGEQPPSGAFDDSLASARTASREAVDAVNDAEKAMEDTAPISPTES